MRKCGVCIATYNVHSCIGVDGRCAPERTGAMDQTAEIARILAMQFHFNATVQEVTGRYGDAILSKTPFTLVCAGSFPDVPRPLPRESRGAIWIETTVAGRPWQIINTHFGLGHGERRLQAHRLFSDWIAPALSRAPVVVCGDFNSRSASTVHRILGEPLRDVFVQSRRPHPRTFPTPWPIICLDYIFVSPGVRVQLTACPKTPLAALASDHFPIIADIEAE